MQNRGTIRRDRRPRLSEPVGRNITALLGYRPWWRSMNFTPSMYDFYHSKNAAQTRRAGPCVPPKGNTYRNTTKEAQPVWRNLASRRKGNTYRKASNEAQPVWRNLTPCRTTYIRARYTAYARARYIILI